MDILENIKDFGNNLMESDFGKLQDNFLKSKIGQVVNFAVNEGLRYILPDFVEDEVIEIKDTLFTGGLKEAADKAVEKAVDLGKTAIGIFTGNFENISQAANAIKKGGLIDGISSGIDDVLEDLTKSNILPASVSKIIKNGKKELLNNVEKNIKNEFLEENNSLEKLEKYIENWKDNYSQKDLQGLKKEFSKIKKEEKNILPIKNIIENINKIKNIHSLIENNANFDFDNIYLQLSEKLN